MYLFENNDIKREGLVTEMKGLKVKKKNPSLEKKIISNTCYSMNDEGFVSKYLPLEKTLHGRDCRESWHWPVGPAVLAVS